MTERGYIYIYVYVASHVLRCNRPIMSSQQNVFYFTKFYLLTFFLLKELIVELLNEFIMYSNRNEKTTYSLGQFLTFIFTIVNYILFFKDYISKHIAHRKAFVHEPRLRDLYYNLSAKRFCNIIHMAGSCIYYRIFRAVYLEIYMIVKSIGAYHPR